MKHTVYLIAIVAGMAGLLFGFDTGIIADAKWDITSQFSLSDFQWSLIVSSTVFGAFLSALFCGKFIDYIGRKSGLMLISIIFVLGTLITTFSNNFEILILGRFILGLCIGISSFTAPLFISEVSPLKERGKLVLFNNIALTGGECIAFLAGYMLHNINLYAWRIMFFIGIIPAILMFIGLCFLPRSPRWVAEKYGINQAKSILKKIRKDYTEEEIRKEAFEIKRLISNNKHRAKLLDIFKQPIRKVLLIGLSLGILQQFAGINIIMYYGPFVFNQAGFSQNFSLFSTLIMGLLNTIFTVVALFIIDKLGRRPLLTFGSLVSGLSLFVVATHNYCPESSPWIALISIMIFIMTYALSIGCVFWLIISEIYPLKIRGIAMSFVTAMQWLANFIISLLFLPLNEVIGGGAIMLVFAIFCFFTMIFSIKYMPETKGVSLEEIEKNLLNGKKCKDLGR